MKTRIYKSILALAMMFVTLPMTAQDYLKIYFKDGHTERHFMHLVESIFATKYDLEGNLHDDYQMQQIIMPDTTYSYYLADIDSMSFTKVDEEQLQKKVTAVANTIEPIFNQCESIEDMEQHLDEIKNIDGVENVYSTGTDIVVQVKDWYNIVYNYFIRQEEPLVTNTANELASRLKKKANLVNSAVNTTKPKVAIVFQMVDNLGLEEELNILIDLKENFERKGFEVTIIADEEKGDEKLDADFYLTRMFDYDMVLLDTHGLSLGRKHALYTGERANVFKGTLYVIDDNLWQDLDEYGIAGCNVDTERLSDGTYKSEVKYYWYVSEDLIKKSSAKFKDPGTHIVFIGACEQLYGKEKSITFDDGQTEYYSDSFAQVLFNKGADFVAGYTKGTLRSGNASNNFYRNLLNGFSLEASLDYLPKIQKKEIVVAGDDARGARLIGLYNSNANEEELKKYFLFKTKTEQTSEQELAETYKSGNVVVSGTTTAEYPITRGGDPMESTLLLMKYERENGHGETPQKLRCGFRHGLDPNLSKNYQEVYCENPEIEEKTTDNVHFSCNIALPPVCGTYYYQAFTYDGLNYNYGDICSFTIPENPEITDGLVAYYPFNGNANDESGNGNHGSVIGNVELTSDRFGNPNSAYRFPGQPFNYISVPDDESLHISTFTLNAWVYTDGEDYGSGYLVCKGRDINNGSYRLGVRNVGASNLYGGTNDAYIEENPQVGVWHMITGTVEGDIAKFYVDGILLDERTLSNPFVYGNSEPLALGIHYYSGVPSYYAYPLLGILDDVRIYNRVLSPSEIESLYREQRSDSAGGEGTSYLTCPDNNHPHMIDLGLPSGTKWACCNVGATTPEGYGNYYAWGETRSKDVYNWDTYFDSSFEKYNNNGGLTELLSEDDAATVNWGAPWRMPTISQQQELMDNCSSEWTERNGVNGRLVTGPNGGQIFLAAAGRRWDGELSYAGDDGSYWSSSLNPSDDDSADYMRFHSARGWCDWSGRDDGFSVRPVCVQQ